MPYYSIRLRRDWEEPRTGKLYPEGVYRVPADISQFLAEKALNSGLANKVTKQRETKVAKGKREVKDAAAG